MLRALVKNDESIYAIALGFGQAGFYMREGKGKACITCSLKSFLFQVRSYKIGLQLRVCAKVRFAADRGILRFNRAIFSDPAKVGQGKARRSGQRDHVWVLKGGGNELLSLFTTVYVPIGTK